jgi:hypothetical protein
MPTDRRLYTIFLPNSTLQTADKTGQQRLVSQSGVGSDVGATESVSTEPSDLRLRGLYYHKYAKKLATEAEELGKALTGTAVPMSGTDERLPEDGYYYVEQVKVNPADPQASNLWEYDVSLKNNGTRASERRALYAGPVDARELTHDFGNSTYGYLSAPSAARQVRWVSKDKSSRLTVSPDQTVTTEHGNIDLYDIDAAPSEIGNRPYITYDIAYDEEGKTDCRVWDTNGFAGRSDGEGEIQWQKVFTSAHAFEHEAVVSNSKIRAFLDPFTDSLKVQLYSSGSWSDVGLGASDWVLDEMDLVDVGLSTVKAQLTFRASASTTDASQGDLYVLDAYFVRGYDNIMFDIPPSLSGPVPADLTTLLDPVASPSTINPQPEKKLLSRKELRA